MGNDPASHQEGPGLDPKVLLDHVLPCVSMGSDRVLRFSFKEAMLEFENILTYVIRRV